MLGSSMLTARCIRLPLHNLTPGPVPALTMTTAWHCTTAGRALTTGDKFTLDIFGFPSEQTLYFFHKLYCCVPGPRGAAPGWRGRGARGAPPREAPSCRGWSSTRGCWQRGRGSAGGRGIEFLYLGALDFSIRENWTFTFGRIAYLQNP